VNELIEASELAPELIGGVLALNTTIHNDSSARSGMFAAHIGQAVTVEGATPPLLKSGTEYEYGEQTFKITAPCDLLVYRILKRFNTHGLGLNTVKENPETYVIYERKSDKRPGDQLSNVFGIFKIPTYHTRNHALGFKYVLNERNYNLLFAGAGEPVYIRKGTIFAHSPSLTDNGDYKYGRLTNVAYMAIPEVEQDGMVVTESFAKAIACTKIESRILQWGNNDIPLNLYGDETTYKTYPEIGDVIRPDKMLFALRTITPGVGVVNLTPKALRTFDPAFDKAIYADAGAVITDIAVNSDRIRAGHADVQFYDKQTERYEMAAREFSRNLRSVYEELSRLYPRTLTLDPDFGRMINDAISDTGGLDRKMNTHGQIIGVDKGAQVYNKVPVGDWRLKVIYVKRIVPGVRFKISDAHGGKGVIVNVIPDADAPINDFGVRADVIMDPDSITKRMNLGKPLEQLISAAAVYAKKRLREIMDTGDLNAAWAHLTSFVRAAAYEQYELLQGPTYQSEEAKNQLLKEYYGNPAALKDGEVDGIELWLPTNRRYFGAEQARRILKEHDFPITPVWYRAPSGKLVRTKDPVLIGPQYIILLEKMGDYWAACSIPKLTHFGTLASLTPADKYALPWRNVPTRFGESELRLFIAAGRGRYANLLLSLASTPAIQKAAALTLLRAPSPMNIPSVIDEVKTPLGRSRPLMMYKHTQSVRGIGFRTNGPRR